MKCHRCKITKEKTDLLGANVFDAMTGTHIITRWYCMFCANVIGLVSNNNDRQNFNNIEVDR